MNGSNRFEPTMANNYPTTATATATATTTTKTMPKIKGSFFFVVSALLASDSSSASTSTSSLRGLKTVDDVDTQNGPEETLGQCDEYECKATGDSICQASDKGIVSLVQKSRSHLWNRVGVYEG